MPAPGRYWADATSIGPVLARCWHIPACLQSILNLTISALFRLSRFIGGKRFVCIRLPSLVAFIQYTVGCLISRSLEAGGRFWAYLAGYEGTEILSLNMIDLSPWIKTTSTDFFNDAWLFHKSRWPPFLAIKWPASL